MAQDNDNKRIAIAAGSLIGLGLIGYAIWQLQKGSSSSSKKTTYTITGDTIVSTNTNSDSNNSGSGSATTLPKFSAKDGYWNGTQFISYSSKDDVLDKNFDTDFINRTAYIYASNMSSGVKAYSDVSGLVPFPAGKYYYEATGQILEIAADGTMSFSSDITKPNNLSATAINESYN